MKTARYRAVARPMHTICMTKSFEIAAKQAGMTDDETADTVTFLAENPQAGDELAGTGGCRKVRIAGRGKGKSGGYRTITFYSGEAMPVYLLTVFSKGEKSSLTARESAALKLITKNIVAEHQKRMATPSSRKGAIK
jgi:hypothetical protein